MSPDQLSEIIGNITKAGLNGTEEKAEIDVLDSDDVGSGESEEEVRQL